MIFDVSLCYKIAYQSGVFLLFDIYFFYCLCICSIYLHFFFFSMYTGLVFRLSQFSAKFSALCLGCDAATTETSSIQNKQHSSLSAGAVFWHRNTIIEAEGGTIESVVEIFLTPLQTSPFVAAATYSCSKMMTGTRVLGFV